MLDEMETKARYLTRQVANNKSFDTGHNYSLPVVNILLLCKAHERLSNNGTPHFFVYMIPANNARYRCEERASGGHFSLKMAAANASNFARRL